jgi:hypothetical protein
MTQKTINTETDTALSIRLSASTRKQADKLVSVAWKEGLVVQGKSNNVRVRHAHVYRLAVEAGLPLVLAKLREMQQEEVG